MNHYMGVDIGTSGCKAVVFDEAAHQASAAYREYDVISPQPGWAELDSEQVMRKCFEVISEAARAAGPRSVRGLGISSQGEAFTPIDEKGEVLSSAPVSFDARAAAHVREFSAQFGTEKLYQITGHTPHPMFSLFKLLWVRQEQGDLWKKAAKFLCYEDLLEHRLGVDPAIGWPLAGRTMLFDIRRHEWSAEVLDAIGLSPDRLARPLRSGTIAGQIEPETARALGLGEGAFVATGGHDQPCGALGAGVTQPGTAVYATGTVECITPAFSAPTFSEDLRASNLCTYDYTVPGMYTTIAFSLTGGNILKWFRDQFGSEEVRIARQTGRNAYELLLEQMEDKPSDLTVLPYFTPSGTPYFDTETAGAVLGLRLSTTRGEFIRALLEGVAFEMRLNLDILERTGCEIKELRAIGGGAKSETWTQLKADVIGKPITVLDVTEAGCLGVAMLAAAADTGEPVAELAARWIRPVGVKQPRDEFVQHYSTKFDEYRRVYPAVRGMG